MACSYAYLAYVLLSFDSYGPLAESFSRVSGKRWLLLAAAVALMPVNWLIESLKWRRLIWDVCPLPLKQAYASVLSGLGAGFVTPNRIGDPVGRVLYIPKGSRSDCAALSAVGIAAQNFATFLCGSIALWAWTGSDGGSESLGTNVKIEAAALAFVWAILYFALPRLCALAAGKLKMGERWRHMLLAVAETDFGRLAAVGGLSLLRFGCYCTQYYMMLLFFGLELSPERAAMIIPLNYLLITLTPSMAAAEAGVRGSWAALLIGPACGNAPGAAFAGICVWALNYIIPMLCGNILLAKKQE